MIRRKEQSWSWTLFALARLLALSPMEVPADEPEDSDHPRFGIWAGAGSGLIVAAEQAVAFRLTLGAELFFRNRPEFAVGYSMTLPVSSDQVGLPDGFGNPFRMAHYFPHIRFFVLGRRLSFQAAPGIAVQHSGGMMAVSSGGTWAGFAAQVSSEYQIELEPNLNLGAAASQSPRFQSKNQATRLKSH